MSEFLSSIDARAKEGGPRRIILTEGHDPRVLEAALRLKEAGLVEPIMVHEQGADTSRMDAGGLTRIEIEDSVANDLEKLLLELRAHKVGTPGELSPEKAHQMSRDPLMYGMYLLRIGKADGLVAGADNTTKNVLRATRFLIGMAPGINTISSSFYMVVPPFRGGDKEEVLTFADCGVVPEPTAEQLADIAIAAADAREFVVGDIPQVAFLSYSTKESGGKEGSIQRVREAIAIIQKKRPDIRVAKDELQGDAALISAVAERKAPGDDVAGKANVLVFPSLDAANIAYKLVERLAPGAKAIGPVLHGLPNHTVVHDLSRGIDADGIVRSATIAAVRSTQ